MRKEAQDAMLVSNLNRLPVEGGRLKTHSYSAHEEMVYTTEQQLDRETILRENAVLYDMNKGRYKDRHEFAALPLRIPLIDMEEIERKNPWLKQSKANDPAVIKFWKNVYRLHKEYRVG